MYTPSFEEFKKMANQGNLVPVYREIMADMETPVSAFLKIKKGNYSFLFESVEGGKKWARYCFLGCDPSIVFSSKGKKTTIIRDGHSEEFDNHGNPLASLKKLMAEFTPVTLKGLPRFFGGAVGFLSYDMVKYFEELPDTVNDDLNQPDAVFIITDSILIFDNVSQKIKIVSNVFLKGGNLKEAYDKAIYKIDNLISRLQKPVVSGATGKKPEFNKKPKVESNFTKKDFKKAVLKGKEYIRNGDIIQVVLAQRLKTAISTDPFNIYRALRTFNPSPYMYYLQLGDLEIVGTSPEVLVRLEENEVEVRPIAGTRPRGITEEEDLALEKELLKDEKERAEHIMLVDLGRNDLGRIAGIGSVNVNEQMIIE
ncbi:MAG TPA: chorismate-binding protein, partial [Nitrospinota bacterium]|nr:chorismate-binding protein [Nitrospinota bacterium]